MIIRFIFIFLIYTFNFLVFANINSEIIGLSVGSRHSCFLKMNTAYCFGDNTYGQSETITGFVNPQILVSGSDFNCVLDDDGVWCWGAISSLPPFMKNVKKLSAKMDRVCAIHENGLTCWGEGQTEIVIPPDIKNPTDLALAGTHLCYIENNQVKCLESLYPIPEFKNPKKISSGLLNYCVEDDQGLKCWGDNYSGQSNVPKKLKKNIQMISLGTLVSGAIDLSNLYLWGDQENTVIKNVPKNLKLPVKKIALGHHHICVEDSESVKCWGSNGNGQTDVPHLD